MRKMTEKPNPANNEENSETPKDTESTEDTDSQELQFGLSDGELQKELHSYAAALRQEFELSQSKTATAENETQNVEKYTRDFFKKNLAHAAAQIVWLSSNSTSDSIRLKASQFIVKEALAGAQADGDPISELLRSLQTPTQPAST